MVVLTKYSRVHKVRLLQHMVVEGEMCNALMLLLCCVLVRLLKKENCNGMYLLRTSLNAESGKVCVCVAY